MPTLSNSGMSLVQQIEVSPPGLDDFDTFIHDQLFTIPEKEPSKRRSGSLASISKRETLT